MRTIDADAALKALRKCQTYLYDARDPELKIELSSAEAAINNLPTIQPVETDTNVGDKISKFIDGLEEIFADFREKHADDSVCGLCEYDGAYMGQSGDWCNECPGFDRDDCFKLSDETRKKWTDEIIKALPTVQPEPHWIPVSERLPEDRESVIACYRCWLQFSQKFAYAIVIGWHASKFGVKAEVFTEWDGDFDYNNEQDENYIPEGWYEFTTQGNGDLMDWYIDAEVIAWMPLPEPFEGGIK